MKMKKFTLLYCKSFLLIICFVLMTACVSQVPKTGKQGLDRFITPQCFDRKNEPYTAIVDSHVHFRPFGGQAIPFPELNEYFLKAGVYFVNIYGIGQMLPADSDCTYYLDCIGTPALPTIKNDFVNAANLVEFKSKGVHMTLSMTFPDLANPEHITETIALYDKEYPNMFKWMGEVNMMKQALLGNAAEPATKKSIDKWANFMALLEERGIPINIHADLGNDSNPTQFLSLIEYALSKYSNNKIIWAHMGLSKELTTIDPLVHTNILSAMFYKYPNLMVDLSWRVIHDNYFNDPEKRTIYVEFMNRHSDRILPGTDFVASRKKDFSIYYQELEVTSRILQYLSDEAFRNIALGKNYFKLMKLTYQAPMICPS